jgi:hypothetical protein
MKLVQTELRERERGMRARESGRESWRERASEGASEGEREREREKDMYIYIIYICCIYIHIL